MQERKRGVSAVRKSGRFERGGSPGAHHAQVGRGPSRADDARKAQGPKGHSRTRNLRNPVQAAGGVRARQDWHAVPPAHGQAGQRAARARGTRPAAARAGVDVKKRVMDARVTNIPRGIVRRTMGESGDSWAESETGRRKRARHDRKYSNSMWHAGYKMMGDGRWFIAYQDDASRKIVGFGAFKEATGRHAVKVLKEAISSHGKPASVMTGRGPQFYASGKENAAGGASQFEKELIALGIRHVRARANSSQTGGKLGRFYGDLQRKLPRFIDASAGKAVRQRGGSAVHVGGPFCADKPRDPVERFVEWYNGKPHRSLDWDNSETPAQAFVRKAAPEGDVV